MGVLEAVLVILALKIPIIGLISFVYWLMKEPTDGADAEKVRAKLPPRLPDLGDRRPRRRGPHGGAGPPPAPPRPARGPPPPPAGPAPRPTPGRPTAGPGPARCPYSTRKRSGTCFSV